jgi:hypothetical protein
MPTQIVLAVLVLLSAVSGTQSIIAADSPALEPSVWMVYPNPDSDQVPLLLNPNTPATQFQPTYRSEREWALDQRTPSNDPPRIEPPPRVNSAIAAYDQIARSDSRFARRVIPEISAKADKIQTQLRKNRFESYIDSHHDFAKSMDQTVRPQSAARIVDALTRETLATVAATNASTTYSANRGDVASVWSQERKLDAERAAKSIESATRAARECVRATLAMSENVLRDWGPSLEFLRGVADEGVVNKTLKVNNDAVDDLAAAFAANATARKTIEHERRSCMPKRGFSVEPLGLAEDVALWTFGGGLGIPTHPPPDIEASLTGVAQQRRSAWVEIAELVEHHGKDEAQDLLRNRLIKKVFGERVAFIAGRFSLFLSAIDPVSNGADATRYGPIAKWKAECDAFVARESKRDDYIAYVLEQQQIFTKALNNEQLTIGDANMLREAGPIVETIIKQERVEKEKNAKARNWCERIAPHVSELLSPRRPKSAPSPVLWPVSIPSRR